MAEWLKAIDCKSISLSYVGSNPAFFKTISLNNSLKEFLYQLVYVDSTRFSSFIKQCRGK